MRVETMWRDASRQLTLRLAPGAKMLAPAPRRLQVRVAGTQLSKTIEFSGRSIDVSLA
jgi:hypothetical protein